MKNTAAKNPGAEDRESVLVDVTGMHLADLLPSDDTVLANSMRRLLAEMDRPQEIIAAFSSYAQ